MFSIPMSWWGRADMQVFRRLSPQGFSVFRSSFMNQTASRDAQILLRQNSRDASLCHTRKQLNFSRKKKLHSREIRSGARLRSRCVKARTTYLNSTARCLLFSFSGVLKAQRLSMMRSCKQLPVLRKNIRSFIRSALKILMRCRIWRKW